MKKKTIAVVGAGPAGCTIARLMAEQGLQVIIFEQRPHIAGNCFDCRNKHDLLIHKYGPHYFRTDRKELLDWLSRFTNWKTAQYLVRAHVDGQLIPLPIGPASMTNLTGQVFDQLEMRTYLKKNVKKIPQITNAKEQCLSTIGPVLYKKFFAQYTKKQWGLSADKLHPLVTKRLAVRFNFDERYPNEKFHVIPADGYTAMFTKMLAHKNIKIELNRNMGPKELERKRDKFACIFYCGAIDQFYQHCFGKLEYRSLKFIWKDYKMNYYQPCVQINYPNNHQYTRAVEIKHITGEQGTYTSVCYEYPSAQGEPFYPVFDSPNLAIYEKYRRLAKKEKLHSTPLYFVGRLAEFKYFNMDQVIIHSRDIANKLLKELC